MFNQRHVLLAAAALASLVAAIPVQDIAFTAHTESTETALMLPTPAPTTTSSTDAIYTDSTPTTTAKHLAPQVPHIESTQTTLLAPATQPTPQTTPQAQAETLAAPTTNSPDQNNAYTFQPATTPVTVYIPHTEATAATVATPNYVAPADSASYNAPTQAYHDNAVPSSQGIVWLSTNAIHSQTNAPATTPMPVLYASVSGAMGLAAGSSAIVVQGKTYSLAAGGSALWIDGSSMSLSMPMTTSKAVHMTSSVAAGTGKVTGSLKVIPTSSVTASMTSMKASTIAAHATTSSTVPVATGAAVKQNSDHFTVAFGIAAGLAGLMAL